MASTEQFGNKYLDIAEAIKRLRPNSTAVPIIEALNIYNPILKDALASPTNDGAVHTTSIRCGLPEVTWTRLYQFIQPTKSITKEVQEATADLEGISVVDAKLIEKAGAGGRALRMSEDMPFIESLGQAWAQTLFYGNDRTHPSTFLGLSPRYSDLGAENGRNIIRAYAYANDGQLSTRKAPERIVGDSEENMNCTSIWFIKWGMESCHLLYPSGTQAGVRMKDYGLDLETNAKGEKRRVYVSWYQLSTGLALRDWRFVVRLCNIDVTQLWKTDFISMLTDATTNIQSLEGTNFAFYMNRTVYGAIQKLSQDKHNVYLNQKDFGGSGNQLTFQNIPIRICDSLINNENALNVAA